MFPLQADLTYCRTNRPCWLTYTAAHTDLKALTWSKDLGLTLQICKQQTVLSLNKKVPVSTITGVIFVLFSSLSSDFLLHFTGYFKNTSYWAEETDKWMETKGLLLCPSLCEKCHFQPGKVSRGGNTFDTTEQYSKNWQEASRHTGLKCWALLAPTHCSSPRKTVILPEERAAI